MLLTAIIAHAQKPAGSLTFQPKAGLVIASMTNCDNPDPRIGLTAGAEVEYQTSTPLSFSLGALYTQQGVHETDGSTKVIFKTDYINVPALVNFYIFKGFAIKSGLQAGFLINDKTKVTQNGVSIEVGIREALLKSGEPFEFNKFDLSLPIGFSYEYHNFVIDSRYNLGLTKVITVAGESTRHNNLTLTFGYRFKL